MPVTKNLYAALQELARVLEMDNSYMNPKGRLWVDAVCINQDDVAEKNRQIPLMGRIYSTARQTIAWVGDQDDGISKAWNCSSKSDMRFLRNSRQSQWSQRLWVVQEAVLAKRLVLASRNGFMIWHDYILRMSDSPDQSPFGNIFAIYYLRNQQQRHYKPPYLILELMNETKEFQVRDERDRLYALYGLVEGISFPVNYGNEYTYAQLLVDFAKWALENIPGLAMLSYSKGNSTHRCSQLCASWMICPGTKNDARCLLYDTRNNALAIRHRAVVQFEGHQRVRLKGAIIDTLDLADYFKKISISLYDPLPDLREIADSIKRMDPSGYKYQRFCATIAAIQEDNVKISEVEQYLTVHDMRAGVRRRFDWSLLMLMAQTHSLCITKTDRFAWVPSARTVSSEIALYDPYTEIGDMICVFQGGRIPYVIHPQGDGTYTLIGECWIEGFMNEEILTMPEYKFDMITLV